MPPNTTPPNSISTDPDKEQRVRRAQEFLKETLAFEMYSLINQAEDPGMTDAQALSNWHNSEGARVDGRLAAADFLQRLADRGLGVRVLKEKDLEANIEVLCTIPARKAYELP